MQGNHSKQSAISFRRTADFSPAIFGSTGLSILKSRVLTNLPPSIINNMTLVTYADKKTSAYYEFTPMSFEAPATKLSQFAFFLGALNYFSHHNLPCALNCCKRFSPISAYCGLISQAIHRLPNCSAAKAVVK